MLGLIDTKVFLISFAIGIFFAYITDPQQKVIHIYPSPDNANKFVYKDSAGSCFKFAYESVNCPLDAKKMGNVPSQPFETESMK